MRHWLLAELKGAAPSSVQGKWSEGCRARVGMLLRSALRLPEWGRLLDRMAYSFGSTVERYGRAYG